jgi:hypothetical protein
MCIELILESSPPIHKRDIILVQTGAAEVCMEKYRGCGLVSGDSLGDCMLDPQVQYSYRKVEG